MLAASVPWSPLGFWNGVLSTGGSDQSCTASQGEAGLWSKSTSSEKHIILYIAILSHLIMLIVNIVPHIYCGF